ncbi:MAG: sigma-70 family RNA polymerase sigma factor [Nocardioides sp.]
MCSPERSHRKSTTAELFSRLARTGDATERMSLVEQVIEINMEVARSIAGRYLNRGVDRNDLEQVAYVGLVKAANGFDTSKGEDFLVYALPTIRGEIRRYFRDFGWTVRIPRRLQETQSLIAGLEKRGDQTGQESPSDLAEQLDVPVEDIQEALAARGCFHPTSLDMTLASGDALGDFVRVEDDKAPAEARAMLDDAVRQLSTDEKKILWMRFYEDRTQQDIGDQLGVSQMQVSRMLARTLARIRMLADVSAEA